jgi:hypothetical protein
MATTLSRPTAPRTEKRSNLALDARETAWRMIGVALIGLALASVVVGGAWDIQWHIAVGRDRALTPPHLFVLGGIALSGLVSLALLLRSSVAAWRGSSVDESSTRLLGVFYAPFGFLVSGFGALLAAVAFPLDNYWHTLYGIDVTLWSPFHVMIVASMVMVGLGALYTLAEELDRRGALRAGIGVQLGFAAMLALTFATLLLLLVQADSSTGLAQIGGYVLALYPILLAAALPIALLIAVPVIRRPGAATAVALVFLGLRQVMFWLVPWAMEVTVAAQGLTYRPTAPHFAVTPFAFPTAILPAALAIDVIAWAAGERRSRLPLLAGTAVVAAVLSGFWDQPWVVTLKSNYPGLVTSSALMNAVPLAIVGAVVGTGMAIWISRGMATTGE